MPPRPLKQVNKDAKVNTVGEYAALQAQHVSLQAARCIAAWTQVELLLGASLVGLLGAKVRPAMAMLAALTSSQAQTAATEAAALTVLTDEKKTLFQATLQAIRKAGKRRNHLAHWIWAYSNDLPDCLLFIEPKEYIESLIVLKETEDTENPTRAFKIIEGVWVYTMADMIELREYIHRAASIAAQLIRLSDPNPEIVAQVMRQLSREPEIQKILARQART